MDKFQKFRIGGNVITTPSDVLLMKAPDKMDRVVCSARNEDEAVKIVAALNYAYPEGFEILNG